MKPTIVRIQRALQGNLLWLLILAYVLGAVAPAAGLWIRGSPAGLSGWLLKFMLALLLLNAGLGFQTQQLRRLSNGGLVLFTALLAGLAAPLLYVLCVAGIVSMWLPAEPTYQLVLGLAVVASMPAAASSTAWSQNAEGNLALSLGILLASTLLAPLTAPVILQISVGTTESIPPDELRCLLSSATGLFLTQWVVAPVGCGMILRWLLGGARVDRAKPYLKLVNLLNLLVLNYANASLALPGVVRNPEPLTLTFVSLTTVGLALAAFAVALPVARIHGVDRAQRASLLFAMGMKNNGAALVLVATAMAQSGPILVPIIFYNLVQHLGAAVVSRFVVDPADPCPTEAWRIRGSLARLFAVTQSEKELHHEEHEEYEDYAEKS
jgi:BASS family bile acid:Na+ symporter